MIQITRTTAQSDSSVFGAHVQIAGTGYLTNTGTTYAVGATEITLDTGTTSLSKGQTGQFTGSSQVYTIASIDAATSRDTNTQGVGLHGVTVTQITVSPALVDTLANNVAFTPTVTASFTDATCDTDHAATGTDDTVFGGNVLIVQMDSTALLAVGMGVSGTGIATNSIITQIDSATLFRVNIATTATNTDQTLTFTPVTGQPLPPYAVSDSVVILADADNAAAVYAGSSSVSNGAFGFMLAAGAAIEVKCTDASSIYIAGTTGDHVYITGS